MSRPLRIAALCIPALCGVLLAVAYAQLWNTPIVVHDTRTYLGSGRLLVWGLMSRSPVYGFFLLAIIKSGWIMLAVWIPVLCWIACIWVFTHLLHMLTGSVRRAVLGGALFVLFEWLIMYTLALQWWMIPDALYSDLVTLGVFVMLVGLWRKSAPLLLGGCYLLALANFLRPMTTSLAIGVLLLLATVILNRRQWPKRLLMAGAAILITPPLVLATMNWVIGGRWTVSPLTGLVSVGYTHLLLEPGDQIYDDAATNEEFHRTVKERAVPEGRTTYDVFGVRGKVFPSGDDDWGPLLLFFSSLDPWIDLPHTLFRASERSYEATMKLIRLHPMAYVRAAVRQTWYVLIPTQTARNRHFFVGDPSKLLAIVEYPSKSEDIAGPLPDARLSDHSFSRYFESLPLGVRLPKAAGSRTALLVISIALGLAILALRHLRSGDERRKVLGIAMLLCALQTLSSALGYSLSTNYYNPRYTVPGLMTAEAAVILALMSIGLRRQKQ